MAPDEQIRSLIQVADDLIVLMDSEIALLHDMRPSEIAPLQADKTRLTTAYEAGVRQLTANPNALHEIDPPLKEAFGETVVRFNHVVADNEIALRAAKQAHDTLLNAVVHAAEKERNKTAGYGKNGVQSAANRPDGGKPLSLTLNRQL